jgi:tetratricopeptide (TPR) repeat protein
VRNDDSFDDLLARARREPLSGEEARRLRAALASSEETRLLYEAGLAFDREGAVQAGDDERIARWLDAIDEPRFRVAPRRQRGLLGALSVGLLLGAVAGAAIAPRSPAARRNLSSGTVETPTERAPRTSASARLVPDSEHPEEPPAPPQPRLGMRSETEAPKQPATARREPDARSLSAPSTALPVDAPKADASEASFAALPPDSSDEATAPKLFAAANRARVSGDTGRAIALYTELEAEFPRSSEALTARLSLGLLLLQKREARTALGHFRSYQARGRGPTLVEAHFGEAQALRQLTLHDEERAALQRLVALFPDSAYAVAAKKRLHELGPR